MKQKSHKYRGIASIFLALLVLLGIAGQIANNWAGKVNELLGVSESTIVRSENPEDYRYHSDFENPSDLIQAEIDLNTRLAVEGSVVLKGMPALEGRRVTLFGMRSGEKMQFGGSMGELIDQSNIVTLADALSQSGFSVNPDMVEFYKIKAGDYAPTRASGGNVVSDYKDQGSAVGEVPVSEYDAAAIGDYRDAAIVVLGRDAGESACYYPGVNGLANPDEFTNSPTGNILSLSDDERDLLKWVKGQGFGKVVVLLNAAMPMEIEELRTDDAVDSIHDEKMVRMEVAKKGIHVECRITASVLKRVDHGYYPSWQMDAQSRKEFANAFGDREDLYPADIVSITYGKKVLYTKGSVRIPGPIGEKTEETEVAG